MENSERQGDLRVLLWAGLGSVVGIVVAGTWVEGLLASLWPQADSTWFLGVGIVALANAGGFFGRRGTDAGVGSTVAISTGVGVIVAALWIATVVLYGRMWGF